jgi:hypothetical protein
MKTITIYDQKDKAGSFVISSSEYDFLKNRISMGMLMFFEKIYFAVGSEGQSCKLFVRGCRKEWVAINTFCIKKWYLMDKDQFREAMEDRISYLNKNYSMLFPE